MKNNRKVGINDSETNVIKKENGKVIWKCPYYKRWEKILKRCYSEDSLKENPSYIGCSVSREWLYFSNFRKWMKVQRWEGDNGELLHIDKDLLLEGNKVYCEEACTFLHPKVNNFMTECKKGKPKELIGFKRRVYTSGKVVYQARCCNPFNEDDGEADSLGVYETEEEAHEAWRVRKLHYARLLIKNHYTLNDKQSEALLSRYSK